MTLFDTLTFKQTLIRVLDRDLNIDFVEQTLGLKLIMEENAVAIFSAWSPDSQAIFTLEESPKYRTRAVQGPKKLSQLVIKASAADIEQLLARPIEVKQVYQGQNGYAFEAISPSGDSFLLHAEDDKTSLQPVGRPNLTAAPDFKGIADFSYDSLELRSEDVERSRAFYQEIFQGQFPLTLNFVAASGADLSVAASDTWDIEILECQVPENYDLVQLKDYFLEKGLEVYLDKKATVLVIEDPSRIEIWFSK